MVHLQSFQQALPDNHIATNNKDREECVYSVRKSAIMEINFSVMAFLSQNARKSS